MKYEIVGGNMPVVVCKLDKGETVYTERGGMSWMSGGVQYKTDAKGGLMKGFARGFAGESMFMTTYRATEDGQEIAFGSSFPGRIIPLNLVQNQHVIVQKGSFLAAESTVTVEATFRKKIGAGLFGGEGFVLLKVNGPGIAFLEFDGDIVSKQLSAGEVMNVDQGYLAMMEPTVQFDVASISGMKNKMFSGEGLFMGKLTGPGKVWLQTMPISNLISMIPTNNS